MNFDDLAAIFVSELGAEREGDAVSLGSNAPKVTILVTTPDGMMPIPKVKSVRQTEGYLVVETDAGQTFVKRGVLFGVRSEDVEPRGGSSRPGFS